MTFWKALAEMKPLERNHTGFWGGTDGKVQMKMSLYGLSAPSFPFPKQGPDVPLLLPPARPHWSHAKRSQRGRAHLLWPPQSSQSGGTRSPPGRASTSTCRSRTGPRPSAEGCFKGEDANSIIHPSRFPPFKSNLGPEHVCAPALGDEL